MKQDKTELILLIDRSGSMGAIKYPMQTAIKSLLDKQKEEAGECLVSTYYFNEEVEATNEAVDIKLVSDISINPNGWTSLNDATAYVIERVGARLAKTPEANRPAKVIFVSITDGVENTSKKFSKEQVKTIVEHQKSKYSWEFLYLGTNHDVNKVAREYGFDPSKVMLYSPFSKGMNNAALATASGISCLRKGEDYTGFSVQDRMLSLEK